MDVTPGVIGPTHSPAPTRQPASPRCRSRRSSRLTPKRTGLATVNLFQPKHFQATPKTKANRPPISRRPRCYAVPPQLHPQPNHKPMPAFLFSVGLLWHLTKSE